MTTVAPPTARPPAPGPSHEPDHGPNGRPPRAHAGVAAGRARPAVTRTLVGLVATALSILPLKALFSDTGWLIDAWLAMIVVLAPAALLRVRRPAGALDIWPGVVLLVPYLTARYVPTHAWLGVIPTTGTWHDISRLMNALHHTTRDDVAPVHTTVAIRLVVCALVGLLAALIDLVAVVGRRGALAGVPMLVVFTVSGAVPRSPVPWYWFAFAAVGFLLVLALGAGDDIDSWGRRIRGRVRSGRRSAVPITAQRIGIIAVLAAILLPLLAPARSHNLLDNAFHNHISGVGGFGEGDGTGGISPFAALKGQLVEGRPVTLMNVLAPATGGSLPYYLRVNVLSQFDSDGWRAIDHGQTTPLDVQPGGVLAPGGRATLMHAQISITDYSSNPPVFAVPLSVSGAPAGTVYSATDDLLLDGTTSNGTTIDETFTQPDPTLAQLRQAPEAAGAVDSQYLELPGDLSPYVRQLVAKLTRNAHGPYARAAALQRYFTDPANGFEYDLTTRVGDSGSELVDFLKGKHGFCQQFAAAMAAMLRVTGVPSRVVLGYMHPVPDGTGRFTITSSDAHAWVEAYFAGIGWIPFDPTPTDGLTAGAAEDPAWAPHATRGAGSAGNQQTGPHATGSGRPTPTTSTSSSPVAGVVGRRHHHHASAGTGVPISPRVVLVVLGLLVVIALLLLPAMLRWTRRRRRLAAARRDGDAEALWAELSDTAVDLGYVWSPARSPRQVVQWLGRDTRRSREALESLAGAVEWGRYARTGPAPALAAASGDASDPTRRLRGDLRAVTAELRQRRSSRVRVGAVLWPASLVRWARPARRR